jgi:perosamine synthetase
MNIPIYKPYLPPNSLKYAHEALDSTWISSQGKYINLAQEKLQELLDVKYALLLNNGTSACHLVAKSLSRKYGKKEIIVPNNVYVAAWNAFLFDKEYTLYSIDADLDTWNYDLQELDKAIIEHPDAAVLVVHNIGNIINIPELQKKYPNTIFVEDACEGLLGKYENFYAGTKAFCSSISFFANKHITSGEGGALLTNDEDTYLFAKCVQGQGQSNKRFIHNELGYNYRITNLESAILLGQIEIKDEILNRKNDIFNNYRKVFIDRENISIQEISPNTIHANWMFGLRINNSNYSEAEKYFSDKKIEIRSMFYSIENHTYLKNNNSIKLGSNTIGNKLNKECIILPSFPELTSNEQNYIINIVEDYLIKL